MLELLITTSEVRRQAAEPRPDGRWSTSLEVCRGRDSLLQSTRCICVFICFNIFTYGQHSNVILALVIHVLSSPFVVSLPRAFHSHPFVHRKDKVRKGMPFARTLVVDI